MENRASSRHDAESSIVCSYLSSRNFSEACNGKMKNYCDSGMYAELPTDFKIGTILVVRSTSSPSDDARFEIEEGVRSISLAEVKWSRKISSDGLLLYGTGFRYLVD
jgi:hypothetical protein